MIATHKGEPPPFQIQPELLTNCVHPNTEGLSIMAAVVARRIRL